MIYDTHKRLSLLYSNSPVFIVFIDTHFDNKLGQILLYNISETRLGFCRLCRIFNNS